MIDDAHPQPPPRQRFREVAAHFASGVAVVTSVADDVPVGTTVNAFTTVSLDPALLLVSLRYGSRLLDCVRESGVFAATVLARDQQREARWFASRTRPTGAAAFDGIPTDPGPATGCLLLADGLAYFDCRVHDVFPGGDHAIVLGAVAACGELWPREPLVFLGSGFVAVDSRGATARQRLGHWPAAGGPVSTGTLSTGAVSVGTAGASAAGSSSSSGLSITARAAGVITRR